MMESQRELYLRPWYRGMKSIPHHAQGDERDRDEEMTIM